MKIKFVDLNRQYKAHKKELLQAITKVLDKGDFILGSAVKEFEDSFAEYVGCMYCVGVDSGTSALMLALNVINIRPGDEVITVPNTFISTAYAISEMGAKVVFVDVDEKTQLMDVAKVTDAITSKTKAIIPVHLFGQMVDMQPLMEMAEKYNILVIEDACQAHGAEQNGKPAGSIGHLACFSFYPGKNLGAYGDAGLIATNSKSFYEKLILLRNYGSPKKYYHKFKGRNARLDTIQAAVLKVKLKYLDRWNKKRERIAEMYSRHLDNVGDLILPFIEDNNKTSYHLYVVRTKMRDELYKYLNGNDIQTVIHYPIPIHLQEAYSELQLKRGSFPITELLADEILSLPIHPDLTNEDLEYTVNCVKDFFN